MLRAACRLVSGNGLGQALQFLCLPLLAHLYSPAQFGVYGTLLALNAAFVVLATLQMNLALVIPRDQSTAVKLLQVGIHSSVLMSCVLSIAALSGTGARFGIAGAKGSALVFVWAFAASVARMYNGWHTRNASFGCISTWAVIRSVALVGAQIVLGYGHVASGLLVGCSFGEAVGLVYLVASCDTPCMAVVAHRMGHLEVRHLLAEYRDFAVVGTVQELVSTAAASLPVAMLAGCYGASIAGQFAMASRLIWAPVTMVGSSVSQVCFQRFSTLNGSALRCHPALRFPRVIVYSLAVLCVVTAFLPISLRSILGAKWSLAAQMSPMLAVWAGAFLVAVPFRVCYRVLRRQPVQLVVDFVLLCLVILLGHGGSRLTPLWFVGVLIVLGVGQNTVLMAYVRRVLAASEQCSVRCV